ncbi:MAG: Ca-activated chloride channel family protein [Paracoccaceae bacterium]|jgi:Ca-activated chloride channel family protein
MTEALQYFHFLRPFWLLALPVIGLLWLLIRPRRAVDSAVPQGIAPHLARALQVGSDKQRRFYPIDGVALAALLLSLAIAGPAWTRMPNPLVADTAPLVVALKVTDSMEGTDLAPSRLERGKFKILDLIAARAGARTALIAYAGTAHRVSPLTEDPNILRPLLEGLTVPVMPKPGADAAAALALAVEMLAKAETDGAILFVLDDMTPTDIAAFNAKSDPPRPPIVFLVAAPDNTLLPQLERIDDASIVRLTADDHDVAQIERRVKSAYAAALAADDRLQWQDRGWMLAWPVTLMALLWFRRGWTMHWVVAGLLLAGLGAPSAAQADGWRDWFLTPDQQGRIVFNNKDFTKAGELFEDPVWVGYAKYKAGQYEEAAEIFSRLDTPEAAFAEGMARIRFREYRPAIAAFETALARRPDYPDAQTNLATAKAILIYVENAREAQDTGETIGAGADDVVFDNKEARGVETQIEASTEDGAPLTAEQWMSSIDTDMTDFLRSRFVLENQARKP